MPSPTNARCLFEVTTRSEAPSWVLGRYLISQHPEVEAKIVEELDSLELLITPERPRPREMVYADLSKMVYLNAVIKVGCAMWST